MKTKLSILIVLSFFYTSSVKSQSCFLNVDYNSLGALTTKTSDKNLDNAILNEYDFLSYKFNVKPNLFFIFDGFQPAAYVTNQVSNPNFPDGTILLGISMLQEECNRTSPRNCTAIPLVLAHEFAHILDIKYQTGLTGKHKELFADFLTGYYFFYRSFQFHSPFEREETLTFYQKDEYTFNTPLFHGTPNQRQSALSAGFQLAYNYASEGIELEIESVIQIAIPFVKQF